MKNRISPIQIKYDIDWSKHRFDLDEEIKKNMVLRTQKMLEEKFFLLKVETDTPPQNIIDITKLIPDAEERIGFGYELVLRVISVSDITQISHDILRSVTNRVHLDYNRHTNSLDVYFEKSQDFVLVKMFTQ